MSQPEPGEGGIVVPMSLRRLSVAPTGMPPAVAREHAPSVDLTVCTACGLCVVVCPAGAVGIAFAADRAWVPWFDGGRCSRCFDCEMTCPEGAIEVPFEIVEEERILS
jgi:ferredoxin